MRLLLVIKPGLNIVSRASCIMTVILYILLIALPSLVCPLSDTQTPFHNPADNTVMAHGTKAAFKFKEGSDVFTPKDLVQLSRPGPGVANVPGDLVLVPVSKYSFEDKKYVRVSSLPCSVHSPVHLPNHNHACVRVRVSCPMLAHNRSFWGGGDHDEMCRKHVVSPSILPGV